MTETASEVTSPAKTFTEPRFALDLRNPKGDLLHVRADSITEMVANINDLWNPRAGAPREDITNLYLFSFNPAIVADMAAGRSAEEAMGYKPDDMATAAYDALAQGAQRQPAGTAAGNGGRSGGSGGGAKTFKAPQIGDDLPAWFRDKLTRHDTCPQCRHPEGVFYDNREDPGKGPVFKCANTEECKAESKDGKYAWGAWEPDSKPANSRTR